MGNSLNINTKDYWDRRFSSDWEQNAGRKQTLYFCNISLELFPDWLKEQLEVGCSFADVGCAEGDCTNYLALKYPNSKFTGIDFSTEAISRAKGLYSTPAYIASDIKDINQKFDIVYTSNTLEHFHRPFEMLDYLFKCADRYVVLLLPFQERQRFEEHFYTFEYKDFNLQTQGFSLVYSREYDCTINKNIYWGGKQILLVYENNSIDSKRRPSLDDYIGDLSENYNILKAKLEEEQEKVVFLQERVHSLDNKLDVVLEEHSRLSTEYSKLNREYHELKQSFIFENKKKNELESKTLMLQQKNIQLKERINYLERQESWLKHENYNYFHELKRIYSSNFWKASLRYYKIRDRTPIVKQIYKSLRVIKNHGFREFLQLSKHKLRNLNRPSNAETNQLIELTNVYHNLIEQFDKGEIEGIAIIPSAFPFEELYNQRTINLAKYLSNKKVATLFVVWQWDKNEMIDRAFQEVFTNVYSIPMFPFIENVETLEILSKISNKQAIINIPSMYFVNIISSLRKNGFGIIYDIMDEWEEFHRVGQAPWYDRAAEESIVLQADSVVAVSKPLSEKFHHIRRDISVVGNGYYGSLLGPSNVSKKEESADNKIHVGYFGHLTESWFDWDLIFETLKDENIYLHIIGYGATKNILDKLKKYNNVKYHGKVNPDELYQYVSNWHLAIIPFSESKLSEAVDPIKIYEYLYFGLPVVVTGIKHLESYPWVKVSSNNSNDFVNQILGLYTELLKGNLSYEGLSEFLVKTTWESRFDKLISENKNQVFAGLYKNAED